MTALLRQPRGFEGLAWVGEALPTHDHALPERVELGVPLVHCRPRSPRPSRMKRMTWSLPASTIRSISTDQSSQTSAHRAT